MSLTEAKEQAVLECRAQALCEIESHPVIGEFIKKHGVRIKEIKILKE